MAEVGHVFVAWGGNKLLAEAVVAALKRLGRPAVLGGDEQAANRSSYLGERVREQIIASSSAIILVEDQAKTSRSRKKNGLLDLRPNLMFEWGLALATLPPELVSPALIAIKREDLPSDLVGMWTLEFNSYCRNDSGIMLRADEIAVGFNQYLNTVSCPLPTLPFEAIFKWADTEAYINGIVRDKRSILDKHFQLAIPNTVIPAIYDGRRRDLKSTLNNNISAGHPPELGLVKHILDYYGMCGDRKESQEGLKRLRIIFKAASDAHYVSPWAKGMAFNFRGVVERKIAEHEGGHEKRKCLNEAREYLNTASGCFESAAALTLEDKHSSVLWKGFVSFNLARTYMHTKRLAEKQKCYDLLLESNEYRCEVYSRVESSSEISDRVKAEFLCEWLATEVALVRRNKKPNDTLVDCVISTVRHQIRKDSRSVGRLLRELGEYVVQYTDTSRKREIIGLQKVLSQQ